MKLSVFLGLGLCLLLGSSVKASTIGDVYDYFAAETRVSFLEMGFVAYGQDIQNGTPETLVGTHLVDAGPLSLDVGLVDPTDASKSGTPLLGGSVNIGKLVRILLPTVADGFGKLAPSTAQNFSDKIFVGVSGTYNFNVQPNESGFMIIPYAGLQYKF